MILKKNIWSHILFVVFLQESTTPVKKINSFYLFSNINKDLKFAQYKQGKQHFY